METIVTPIELLAPAKDLECGMAAIACGADAVYLGAGRFGAREAAGNALPDIETLVRYAHAYWAKVYVTINTLLTDEELPAAQRLIERLYTIGVDGIIIQDAGLLELDLPPIPLIASTQMHNHTPERVAFLEGVGLQRVILARELSLDEIRAIRARTAVELEAFVHGALCVCYSGQCYLSYALGGRSGNRGQCAQPCRKSYTLTDADGTALARHKHLLSLRDLNLTDHLAEMLDAGICSFKIEGRLKEKSYVANVVAHYRTALDAMLPRFGLKRSSSGTSIYDFAPNPAKTFNRGYCSYFLPGRGELIGALDTPKMVGERLGPVTAMTARGVKVQTDIVLHPGDGLCFFDAAGALRGTTLNGVESNLLLPEKLDHLAVGTMLYRNHDHAFLTHLAKTQTARAIAVRCTLRETPDGIALSAVDEDGNRAEVALACAKVPAKQPEMALDNIRKQLRKTGGTLFACAEVAIELTAPLFFPVALLNALRRDVLEALAAEREVNRPVRRGGAVRNDIPFPATALTFTGNVLNASAEAFYRRHGVTAIEPGAETGMVDLRGRALMTTRYCVRHQLGLCPRQGAKGPAAPLYLTDMEGDRLELRFACDRCEMEVYVI
jgi:collagenase-like PrtC family protease